MKQVIWRLLLLGFVQVALGQGGADKPILAVLPRVEELGTGWQTNQIAYLLDPKSSPAEIAFRGNPESDPLLAFLRKEMRKDGRTGFAIVHYGRPEIDFLPSDYRVYLQRWKDSKSLHNAWVDWKMDRNRVVRSLGMVGEDFYWTFDGMLQKLCFRRGLFTVLVESEASLQSAPMLRLAEVIDAKVRGRPIRQPTEGE